MKVTPQSIQKYIQEHWIGGVITLGAIIVVSLFHWFGVFDTIELKTYDYRFNRVRGPLTGWTVSDSTYINSGTDVVLVEVDDEAYRLLPEEWPYPRGSVWGRVVRNLYKAGAKVIVFDIQFDTPDKKSEIYQELIESTSPEYIIGQVPHIRDTTEANYISKALPYMVPRHGDKILGEAISEAQMFGTTIVMDIKMATEATSVPPQYIVYPVDPVKNANPEMGLINDQMDMDGFSRRYAIFGVMAHEPEKYYLSLAVKALKAFKEIPDTAKPYFDEDNLTWEYGGQTIKAYGAGNTFLVNYYGPASGYKYQGEKNLPAWGTFPKYSLAYVIDTEDVTLRDPMEDLDWMSQFLPGEMPEWIKAIEDPQEQKEMMDAMGIGEEFDITSSPFYNKIVVIGVSVEVLLDLKRTPYYNFWGIQQMTPGYETHGNAIQTLLDNNYIEVLGGQLTELIDGYPYSLPTLLSHSLLIALMSLIAFFILSFLNPVYAGILIVIQGIVYFAVACGLFVDDLFWFVRNTLTSILPVSTVAENPQLFQTSLPEIGKSYVIPIVAPIISLVVTYTGNVIYKFINEQKNKRFLKSTFGAYISPDLIDQMYSDKQEPKLGGVAGYHTAFFSDIQSFSAFSEVLEPERMVSLMNEYLTEMTNILLEHKGTLDKYIGDAIVAFYGAPVSLENHEYHACLTALEMEKKLEMMRSQWSSDEDWPKLVHNIRHRVGLNSGQMVTGNMGSAMRMNYTMMGDTVNLAARLEPAAKHYGVYLLVAENTQKVVADQFEWRFLDYLRVKGKKKPVKAYELLSLKNELSDEKAQLVKAFDEGIDLYNNQDWLKAKKRFKDALSLEEEFPYRPTTPSAVYIERCDHFKKNPPKKDWDGVWTMTTK